MIKRKNLLLPIFLLFIFQSLHATSLTEEFKQVGYVEICDNKHGKVAFNTLYTYFDKLIEFLQKNPVWAKKLYAAKERFIRSKDRNYYCTDFFGFYDESKIEKRSQISFYYSIHLHEFICSHYPEFNQIPEIIRFFEACREIQKSYGDIFDEAAAELGLSAIFSSNYGPSPNPFQGSQILPLLRCHKTSLRRQCVFSLPR